MSARDEPYHRQPPEDPSEDPSEVSPPRETRPEDQKGPPRRALLVGIDAYPNLPPARELRGCVEDAELAGRVLRERFGFTSKEIRLLRDGEATRDAIREALDELSAFARQARTRAAEKPLIFLHYSGHGSQVRSQEKSAGWCESLVAADSGRDVHPNRDILDVEIGDWIAEIVGITPRLVLVFDCCHSGSISRNVARTRGLEPDPRPVPTGGIEPGLRSQRRGTSGWPSLEEQHVLVAACAASEVAYETDRAGGSRAPQGALSHHLYRSFLRAPEDATFRDVFDSVRAAVELEFPGQHPQLEGARDRGLFDGSFSPPRRHLRVIERSDRRVILDGGAPHGVVPGSEWSIQGPEARGPGESPLATVRVSRVEALRSDAEIVEADGGDRHHEIEVGARAFEERRPADAYRFRVHLEDSKDPKDPAVAVEASRKLRRELDRADALRLVEDPADGEAWVRRLPAEGESAVPGPAWVVETADGSRLGTPQPLDREESSQIVRRNLERRARYCRILRLESPHTGASSVLDLRLQVSRADADGAWERVDRDAAGICRYRQGERMAFEIGNRGPKPYFVYLFHLGADGEVVLLDPVEGGHEALAPGRVRGVGKNGFALEATPTKSKVKGSHSAAGGNGGFVSMEYLKVVATRSQTDLSIFSQGAYRNVGRARAMSELERLLGMAWAGPPRDARRGIQTVDLGDWLTCTRAFRVE